MTKGEYKSPHKTADYRNRESLEYDLDSAGLTQIRWTVPAPSAEGMDNHGAAFWADLMRSPFELIVTCRKG